MEAYLPEDCYSSTRPFSIEGICIHFISCINVDAANALDTQANCNLLFDLNRGTKDRMYYPMPDYPNRQWASYHDLIGRDGEERFLVPEDKLAYHAGMSNWRGKPSCNGWMYGIALIGHKTSMFTAEQYEALAQRCKALMDEYGFPIENIAGHEEVAPGRKYDPGIHNGNFNKERLLKRISELYSNDGQ